jgi:hypothetical protein
LLAHGRWFSPCTPAASTTKTGRHDIAEILLKVASSTKNQIKSNHVNEWQRYRFLLCFYNVTIIFGTVLTICYFFLSIVTVLSSEKKPTSFNYIARLYTNVTPGLSVYLFFHIIPVCSKNMNGNIVYKDHCICLRSLFFITL